MAHFVGQWTFGIYQALPSVSAVGSDSPWSDLNSRVAFVIFMHKLHQSGQGRIADQARKKLLEYIDRNVTWFFPCEKGKIFPSRSRHGISGALVINAV